MSQLTEAEIRVLRAAGFTQREINTQQLKFHNLLRVKPWLVEDLERRGWVGLTDLEFAEAAQIAERGNYLVAFHKIQTKLKEKNT